MNILSFLATAVAVLYAVLFVNRYPNSKGDPLVQCSLAVFACLGWWNLCDAFFYGAPTQAGAWFWLRLGALGWNGFIPVTAWYFILMCDDDRLFSTLPRRLAYWLPGLALTFLFMLPGHTPFADSLVQSPTGLGWAYRQSYHTGWPFAILIELAVYLGGALLRLFLWQRRMEQADLKTLSKGFIILDFLAVSTGVLFIYLLPLLGICLPPLSCIATLIFMVGYWIELRDHDLTHIEMALDPHTVFDQAMDGLVITDSAWRILYTNGEAEQMLGRGRVKNQIFLASVQKEDCAALRAFAQSNEQKRSGLEFTLLRPLPVLCSVSRANTRRGGHQVYLLFLHDASNLRSAQARLEYLARYDELTGLLNRRGLDELLLLWEKAYRESGRDFHILFLDLNRFKQINDDFGHAAGDLALQKTAAALRGCLCKQDEVSRLSGDEFVVLHKADSCAVAELTQKLRDAVCQIDCQGFAPGCHLEVSIGACSYAESGSIQALFRLADQRMYAIKAQMHQTAVL